MQLLLCTHKLGTCVSCIIDFIFQQYIAICNKCTSVPLTDAHLQRTCSEIVHVQPQSSDHTLNHTRIDRVSFSEAE